MKNILETSEKSQIGVIPSPAHVFSRERDEESVIFLRFLIYPFGTSLYEKSFELVRNDIRRLIFQKSHLFILILLTVSACDKESESIVITEMNAKDSVIAVPLRFITADYIELNKIERISKFRSGIGHDYRDDAESCRSMKHYYQPVSGTSWSAVKIFSPVTGTVVRTFEEWAGTQVWIRPASQQMFTIIIFHIALLKPLAVGDSVAAGAQLGTHIGPQTMSDIAVGYSSGSKWQLISYFSIMSDSLFKSYTDRGVLSRDDLIITKAARDADPLNCSGEVFGSSGTLGNWITLK